METEPVVVERDGAVVDVRLNRPRKRNALNLPMLEALHAALDQAEAERASVMLIRGVDGVFCAGADLAVYAENEGDLEALGAFGARAKSLMRRLSRSPVVIVAAVDGVAMGGGFELVLSCDVVLATERARFGLPEIRLGLIPGWEGTQRLARHVGPNKAKEAIMLARVMGADELRQAGLVNRVTTPDELDLHASELAAQLAGQAPLALAAAKRTITAAVEPDASSAGSDLETRELLDLFASQDGREGVAAFLNKRAPRFTGR